VNAASLPYTIELLLAELAVGTLAAVTLFDARGAVTLGYVKSGAVMVVALAVLALWTALAGLSPRGEIEGYALSPDWVDPFRVALVAFTALAAVHLFATFGEHRRVALWAGALGSLAGAATLAALAGVVGAPAWSYAGVVASTLVSAAVLGGALAAMTWGHWYLTNSGLPKEPLEQMSLLLLGALVAQLVLVAVALVAPVREVPFTDSAFGVELGANPAFWLRVGVGLLFPAFLAWLAWRAAAIRGMMSATGLLYIALGAVLAGAVLARGLLFSTGAVV
jgi:hypothetical protein